MLKLAAHIVSILFHPLLMPTYLFGIIGYYTPAVFQSHQLILFFIVSVFAITAVLPALNLMFFKVTGTVKNLYMPTRGERVVPFVFISVVYILVTALTYLKIPVPVVPKFLVISSALVVTLAISTFSMKISAHAIGVAGLAGILLALAAYSSASALVIPAIACIILSGVVMSSRLLLNAHTINEVTWGGILGFAVGFAGVLILF